MIYTKIHSFLFIISAFMLVGWLFMLAQPVSAAQTATTMNPTSVCGAHLPAEYNIQHDATIETEQPQRGMMRCCLNQEATVVPAATYYQYEIDSRHTVSRTPNVYQLTSLQNSFTYIPPSSLAPPEEQSIRSIVKRE